MTEKKLKEKSPSRQRHFEDIDSGEQLYAIVPIKQNTIVAEGWFIMFQNPLKNIAKDKELTLEHHRVLMYLCSQLDMNNFIRISQSDVAKEISMQRSHVSEALKFLVSKEIIIKGQKIGTSWTYIFNSKYGYKGPLKNINKERKKHLTLIEDNKTAKELGLEE